MIEEQTFEVQAFEEQAKEKPDFKRKIKRYLRWFVITVTMIAIGYTIVMAVMKKFSGV